MASKRQTWKELLSALDNDQWGQGYKIVMKKLKSRQWKMLNEEQQVTEAGKLFPVAQAAVRREEDVFLT